MAAPNLFFPIVATVVGAIVFIAIVAIINYLHNRKELYEERKAIPKRSKITVMSNNTSEPQLSERTGFVGTGTWIALVIIAIIGLGVSSALGINVSGFVYPVVGLIVAVFFATGIRIVRPTHRAVIERLGKFQRVQKQGITWIVPFVDKSYMVNITAQMTEAEKQEVITQDNLNASIAALIRFKVKDDDDSVKLSQYAVSDYRYQIVQLGRTTLRNVIGTKDFKEVNSQRNILNGELRALIEQETTKWGIEVVNFEMKEIEPPKDVQETMNLVIKASNQRQSAIDFATAVETEADGKKRAAIKQAEGSKEARRLEAEGQAIAITTVAEAEAKAIEKVNTAAREFFKEGAVEYRRLEVTENALKNNAKYIITQDGIAPSIILPTAKEGGNGGSSGHDDSTLIPVPSTRIRSR